MNRIEKLFAEKKKNILSIYFTAGYPGTDDTLTVLQSLQDAGVDLVEIGMPYSDPVADGETIQASNQQALEQGMSVEKLLGQLSGIRESGITLPIILMGYLNPVYQYGIARFCAACESIGIDGLILPDLPLDEFRGEYEAVFAQHGLFNIFLITPQTSDERIREIDGRSKGFIYMVSSASVTGATSGVSENMEAYFDRVNNLGLANPRLVGFGIKDKESFQKAAKHASGAIIGSQFVRVLESSKDNLPQGIHRYIKEIIAD
jgi:tryptophan synthase alpha chain